MTRKIPRQLTLILAIFTCTFFLYRDFGLRMLYGYALLGLLLSLHLLDRLRRDQAPLGTPILSASFLLVLVISLHYLRPDARWDEDTLSYFISMVICMTCLLFSPNEVRDLRRAGVTFYVGAMSMAAFVVIFTFLPELFLGLIYPLLSDTAKINYDFFSPLGYGVSLGGYSYSDYILYIGMAVCCADLAVNPRTSGRVVRNGLSLAFLLLAMVILGRRGELLAALVATGLLVLALCRRKQRRIILLSGAVCAIGGIALVLALLPYLSRIPFLARYVETVEQILSGADFSSGRGLLMGAAIQGFLAHPVFGMGWGQYQQLTAQISMYEPNGKLMADCHNIYLQFLCETGITGAILLLIPIFYLLITTTRMLKAAKSMEDKAPLRFAAISFLLQVFLLVLGLYDPSFQKIVFWCFYALALMFCNTALVLSGWRPTGPVSRVLERFTALLAPVGSRIFDALRTPWKEGHR